MNGGRAGRIGVVLMAYGTPGSTDEILPYYTDIRRGRPPTDEQLADLTRRYNAIGGLSPLAELTERQRDALQHQLDLLTPQRYTVSIGLKHAHPSIEAAVDLLAAAGVERIIGLVLAPHYSAYSVGQYLDRARTAAAAHEITVVGVESWATESALIEFLTADLSRRHTAMPGRAHVLFTAHSLPERIIATGDPYLAELRSTAEAIAAKLGLDEGNEWSIAWQSAGRTPEPWLSPEILTVIDQLGADETTDGIIVCACGFVADHLEVLYDLDIEADHRAATHGLRFDRTACVNDTSTVMAALAARVHAAAGE